MTTTMFPTPIYRASGILHIPTVLFRCTGLGEKETHKLKCCGKKIMCMYMYEYALEQLQNLKIYRNMYSTNYSNNTINNNYNTINNCIFSSHPTKLFCLTMFPVIPSIIGECLALTKSLLFSLAVVDAAQVHIHTCTYT